MPTSYESPCPNNFKSWNGGRSDVSRPPQSPSIAAAHLENSRHRGSVFPTATRKRARGDTSPVNYKTPLSAIDTSSTSVQKSSSFGFTDTTSPPTLGNARYRLFGGLDTPTEAAAAGYDHLNIDTNQCIRRLWINKNIIRSDGSQRVTVTTLESERNGARRIKSTTEMPQETWGRFVFNVVGEIAGKMWEFCRTSAFRGFTAGGGIGYAMTTAGPKQLDGISSWSFGGEKVPGRARGFTPVPGQFPDDDGLPEPQASPPRPAKRLQTSQASGWVMVDHADSVSTSPRMSSVRTPNPTRLLLPRHIASHVNAARRSRLSTARLSSVSHADSSHLEHGRTASFASPRSPVHSPQHPRSPSSADIQKYTSRIYREEKQNEASMRKLNQQLKAMIKQGKEALATKVEVQDDAHDFTQDEQEEDEGFAEGDYDMGGKHW